MSRQPRIPEQPAHTGRTFLAVRVGRWFEARAGGWGVLALVGLAGLLLAALYVGLI